MGWLLISLINGLPLLCYALAFRLRNIASSGTMGRNRPRPYPMRTNVMAFSYILLMSSSQLPS
jgi:hypothetical protein